MDINDKVILSLTMLWLDIELLETLANEVESKSPTFENGPEFIDSLSGYLDGFDDQLEKLRNDIETRRDRLLEAGVEVPDSWLLFPIRIAWRLDRETMKVVVDKDQVEAWKDISNSLQVRIRRIKHSPEAAGANKEIPQPDGPCGINQWRFKGAIVAGAMTHKQHRLATHLFERLGQKVQFGNLIGTGCLFEVIQEATIQRHGSNIGTWFAERDIPLAVSTGDGSIWMESRT